MGPSKPSRTVSASPRRWDSGRSEGAVPCGPGSAAPSGASCTDAATDSPGTGHPRSPLLTARWAAPARRSGWRRVNRAPSASTWSSSGSATRLTSPRTKATGSSTCQVSSTAAAKAPLPELGRETRWWDWWVVRSTS
ncbi:hypothetical protein KEF29_24855 [Streptomyces tuirus]|uniref:Uncharacterized protein n=1 Tax=Streptomyces tuirus TaxID=68278 RepID=A0A941FCE6_9ACTN|nr:hypothetical protein [Streptomyces tuirus]